MQSTPYDGGRLDQVDEMDRADEIEVDDASDTHAEIEWKKAEIEQTRAEMTDTLSAIKDRLQPQVLMDQAKEKVHDVTTEAVHRAREATIGRAHDAMENVVDTARDAGSTVVNRVRENPIPIALIGVGVAWLLADAMRTRRDRYSSDYYSAYDRDYYEGGYGRVEYRGTTGFSDDYTADENGGGIREKIGGVKDNLREAASTLRERAGEMAGTVRERAGELTGTVRERAGEMTGTVRERASDMRDRVGERTGEVAGRARVRANLAKLEARDMVSAAGDCVHDTMQNNPMAVGLVALGIGAAIGFLLPETRREHEMMGEARDRVMDTAREAASEVKDKVQNVAQKVQGVATEAMSEAKQVAKDAMSEAKQVAKDEARNQGLTGEGAESMAASGTGTSTSWPNTPTI